MPHFLHHWPARVLAALLSLPGWPAGGAWAQAGVQVGAGEASVAVRQVVLDIISYTRWPEPPGALRLCVVGAAVWAEALGEAGLFAGSIPVRRWPGGERRPGGECDVLYAGALTGAEREALARSITGYPVLTVGEASPGCIETTMFCLTVRGAQVSFATNLDAIARSGVRLNPRVLLLGRRPGGGR